jgi:hypothetical protein
MHVLFFSQDFSEVDSLRRLLEQNDIVVAMDIDESRRYPGIFGGPSTYRLCLLADEQLADALALLKDPHHDVVVTQSRLKLIDEDAAPMSFSDRILSKIIKVFAKF